MSVVTEADQKLDSAERNIQAAISDMSAVVIERVWGWDAYRGEYQQRHREVLNALIDARQKLDRS